MPSTKKCGLKRRIVVPVTLAATATASSAPSSTNASADEVVRRDERRAQVQERPVVGRRGAARAGRLPAAGSTRSPGGCAAGSAATSGPAASVAIGVAVRRMTSGGSPKVFSSMVGQLGDQPVARGSSCRARRCRRRSRWSRTLANACSVNRNDSRRTFAVLLTSVSESGSAKMTRSYFLSVVRRNARPSLLMRRDARVVVGLVRDGASMPICWIARIDLDGVDVPGPVALARCADVRPAAGADDQHLVVGPAREPVVDLLVERSSVLLVERVQRLVRDAVDVDVRQPAGR